MLIEKKAWHINNQLVIEISESKSLEDDSSIFSVFAYFPYKE